MKLNIGCGHKKMGGCINIDISKDVNPDKVVNIEEGLPFKDNYFDEIYSRHVLEHIRPQYWKFVLEEIGRVTKKGGIITLDLPFDNIFMRTNADHYRTFEWGSFDVYRKDYTSKYYMKNFIIERLNKKPSIFKRIPYYIFPFLKSNVRFVLKIVK